MQFCTILKAASFMLLADQALRASTIHSIFFETRPYAAATAHATAAGYVSNWAALAAAYPTAPAGYGSSTIAEWNDVSNQNTFSGWATDLAYRTLIQLTVDPAEAGTWDFRFGIDFGLGGVLLVDGVVADFRNTDMWWENSFVPYSDPTQILSASVALAAGQHSIEVLGLEGCCDGPTQGQYRAPGGSYRVFAATAADPVPEPASALLALTGLGAWAFRRRRG